MWLSMLFVSFAAPSDAVVVVQQGSGVCAGTFVDAHGTVLTAYHCVMRGGRPRIRTRDGRSRAGRVVNVDRHRDLAWIRTDFENVPFRSVSRAEPSMGTTVRVIGHPGGAVEPGGFFTGLLRWSISDGTVSNVGASAVQITAPVNPGNSGGPVLNADGDIIGVVSRRLSGDGLGFAGRVDADPPSDRFGLWGGRVAAEVFVQGNDAGAQPLSVGAGLAVELRDRIVLGASGAVPIGLRWQALASGEQAHSPLEARIALRQRFLRGPFTFRVDGFVGGMRIDRTRSDGDGGFRTTTSAAPMAGGRFQIRGVALDIAAAWTEPMVRARLTFEWPGTLFKI